MHDGKRWVWAAILLYALVCRLLPWALSHVGMPLDPQSTWYPWNFAPMMAVTLLCGAGVKNWRWALVLPLALRAVGDIGIGLITDNWEWAFPGANILVYGSFVLAAGLGMLLRSRPQLATALPAAFLAELAFFLISNFGVWWLGEGLSHYPPTLSGLIACYIAAIPFFGRSVLSTLIFTGLLFSPAGLRMAGIAPVREVELQPAVAS